MKENLTHFEDKRRFIARVVAGYIRQYLTIENKICQDPSDEMYSYLFFSETNCIRRYISEQEHDELDAWITENDQNMQLFEEWTEDKHIKANLEWLDEISSQESPKQLPSTKH